MRTKESLLKVVSPSAVSRAHRRPLFFKVVWLLKILHARVAEHTRHFSGAIETAIRNESTVKAPVRHDLGLQFAVCRHFLVALGKRCEKYTTSDDLRPFFLSAFSLDPRPGEFDKFTMLVYHVIAQ